MTSAEISRTLSRYSKLGSGDTWGTFTRKSPSGETTTHSARAGSGGRVPTSGGGSSTQQRVMDVLRSKGMDPWITPEGKISTNPREGTSGYIGYGAGRVSSGFTEAIRKQKEEAEKKAEAEYQQAKAAIDAAYQAGLMTDTEYQDALNESFKTTRAQYGVAAQGLTESAYGQVNVGAVKGQLATLRGQEAEAIGRGERDVRFQRAEQRATAAEKKAAGYMDLYKTREIPGQTLPAGLSRGETTAILSGPTPTVAPPPPVRSDFMSGPMRRG